MADVILTTSVKPKKWCDQRQEVFQGMDYLHCFSRMVWFYQRLRASIHHLADRRDWDDPGHLARMTSEQVRGLRRYINTDLLNYSIEFYLQQKRLALEQQESAKQGIAGGGRAVRGGNTKAAPAQEKPSTYCVASVWAADYTYDKFLGDTLSFFTAIHAHLVSINRAFGDLYYYSTELPLADFTAVGKNEILHLTRELDRVMTGLMVAIHLQPRSHWQSDLISYLVSCRADCGRLFETIPRYYQSHRLRLVAYPYPSETEPNRKNTRVSNMGPLECVTTCLPWSAGVYLDFITAYQSISRHTMAVIQWAIRLYALWHPVPKRVLDVIDPSHQW